MHRRSCISLALLLVFTASPSAAIPSLRIDPNVSQRPDLPSTFRSSWRSSLRSLPWRRTEQGQLDTNKNGSAFLWVIQDKYEGKTFFDGFEFFTDGDPTHGQVNFVTQQAAIDKNLVYVTDENKVIMKGDNTSYLASGQYRDSVRISSKARYHTGLFILDLSKAPWGCAVWPAFWTVGNKWPYDGEIDIIEGVHDNEHNQVTWHTAPGCSLDSKANFTGTIVSENNLACDGTLPGNPGCGITEWSRASYGPYFDAQGGGVFAMKWDEDGISVWSFYRAAIPQDIVSGEPNPSLWGVPSAALDPSKCDPLKYFVNHSIIFDITFCGDWAGNSYKTSGCPGSCAERLMNPRNFDNATWIINSLKVYKKQAISGGVWSSAKRQRDTRHLSGWIITACLAIFLTTCLVGVQT